MAQLMPSVRPFFGTSDLEAALQPLCTTYFVSLCELSGFVDRMLPNPQHTIHEISRSNTNQRDLKNAVSGQLRTGQGLFVQVGESQEAE